MSAFFLSKKFIYVQLQEGVTKPVFTISQKESALLMKFKIHINLPKILKIKS